MAPRPFEVGGVSTLADAEAADEDAEPALAIGLGSGIPVAGLRAVGAGAAVRSARLPVEPNPFERSLRREWGDGIRNRCCNVKGGPYGAWREQERVVNAGGVIHADRGARRMGKDGVGVGAGRGWATSSGRQGGGP